MFIHGVKPPKGVDAMATMTIDQLNQILFAYHYDPFSVLGAHPFTVGDQSIVAIRAFRPDVQNISVVWEDGSSVYMERLTPDGFYELVVPQADFRRYHYELDYGEGSTYRTEDTYRFGPVLGDLDLQLIGEGEHHHLYNVLGAHLIEHEGVGGTVFAVWAPNAQSVSVVGSFNHWDSRAHQMRSRGGSGVWELFIPGILEGHIYKYRILTKSGMRLDKSDPFAFAAELRPETASKVWDVHKFEWHDEAWLEKRKSTNWLQEPMNIYEVYLPSWMRDFDNPEAYPNYRELAPKLADYCISMGYTHIEILPITEYPYDGSWGYQVSGYFAPTSRMGSPDDFQAFVDLIHQRGIGILMDWVPAHFPRDAHGLARFDGEPLYEYPDPRKGEHRDWGTLIFDYGRNQVRNFLIGSALFWLDKYHIDGFRVDAVASMLYLDYSRSHGDWVPNQYGGRENLEAIYFLRRLNELTHQYHPGIITVAEESTSFPMVTRPVYLGGLGFDFKWNMGWMNDTLEYIKADPIYRKYLHNKLTFGLMYAFSENFILPISHDEVVHLKKSLAGKMPGDYWQQMANVRTYLGFMFTHPGKKLLFMGQDIAQWREFSELREIDWYMLAQPFHKGVNDWAKDLFNLVKQEPALYEQDNVWEGFQWVDVHDYENSIISYLRIGENKEDFLLCIHNFTPIPRYGYRIGAPRGGEYREVLNSDGAEYGGSGVGNGGSVTALEESWGIFSHTLQLTLPPLATLILKPPFLPILEPEAVAESSSMIAPEESSTTKGIAEVEVVMPSEEAGTAKPRTTRKKKADASVPVASEPKSGKRRNTKKAPVAPEEQG